MVEGAAAANGVGQNVLYQQSNSEKCQIIMPALHTCMNRLIDSQLVVKQLKNSEARTKQPVQV